MIDSVSQHQRQALLLSVFSSWFAPPSFCAVSMKSLEKYVGIGVSTFLFIFLIQESVYLLKELFYSAYCMIHSYPRAGDRHSQLPHHPPAPPRAGAADQDHRGGQGGSSLQLPLHSGPAAAPAAAAAAATAAAAPPRRGGGGGRRRQQRGGTASSDGGERSRKPGVIFSCVTGHGSF